MKTIVLALVILFAAPVIAGAQQNKEAGRGLQPEHLVVNTPAVYEDYGPKSRKPESLADRLIREACEKDGHYYRGEGVCLPPDFSHNESN